MKNFNLYPLFRKLGLIALALILTLSFSLAPGVAAESAKDIVNVGVTYTLNTMNPFLYDATLVNHAALSLEFQPLVELKPDMQVEYLLASEVSTEDNLTFTIKLNEEATWSDGEPITADDVIFTIMKITSRDVGNLNIYNWSAFEGFDEGGQLDHDATLEDVPSIEKVDDKSFTLTAREYMPTKTLINSYLRYIYTVPQRVFEDMSGEELRTTTWFNKPEIVSGPYRLVDLNLDHYASFVANENYWRGKPQIEHLNIRVVQGSSVLAGLQSGELDIVPATLAAIPVEDQAVIMDLEGFEAKYDKPLTNNFFFINTEKVPDPKVREAMAYAINRELILEGFLNSNGEITEGFLNSYSPFKDEDLEVRPYDPEKAKELMAQSAWDESEELLFLINSGDPVFTNVANVIVQQLAEVGIKARVQALDLGSLLAEVNQHKYDLMAVQYTIVPIDPLDDISWLAESNEGTVNWSLYESAEMNEAIQEAAKVDSEDLEALTKAYSRIDQLARDDTPFINLYVESPLGIMSKKLENAHTDSFGVFNNVQEWTFAE